MPAIIMEKEEDDSLVYCMSWGATDILKGGGGKTDTIPFHRKAYREFFSFDRHSLFHLECSKGRHNNYKLQSIIFFFP
jgi:hypothetical protein